MIFMVSLKIKNSMMNVTTKPPLSALFFLPKTIIYLYIHYVAIAIANKMRLQIP